MIIKYERILRSKWLLKLKKFVRYWQVSENETREVWQNFKSIMIVGYEQIAQY